MKISICIPTYNRLDVFKQAIQSCLNQTKVPHEILIGDDSSNDHTGNWIKNNCGNTSVQIRYFKHMPALRQAHNVDFLFQNATGDFIILLHDDDILLENAVEYLYKCFESDPEIDVVYGKQYLIDNNGEVNLESSEKLNQDFYRCDKYGGVKLSPLEAAMLQQVPNDGYMLKANLAKSIKYSDSTNDACDFEFGLRLGLKNCKMYFLNKYISKYRLSKDSVSKKSSNNAALNSYLLVEKMIVDEKSQLYKQKWMYKKAPVAIGNATSSKQTALAFKIYFSEWHRKQIFSLRGIKRFISIVYSIV